MELRAAIGVVVVLGAVAIGAAVFGLQRDDVVGLDELVPKNIAALNSANTAVAKIPDAIGRISTKIGADPPGAGSLHMLGHRAAFAWSSRGQICWVRAATSSSGFAFAQCVTGSSRTGPIDPVLIQPEATASVEGPAVNDVRSVVATMKNGQTRAAAAVGNFYEITLPRGMHPWDVASVTALLKHGKRYTRPIAAPRPAG
jgi:hypothetical protein